MVLNCIVFGPSLCSLVVFLLSFVFLFFLCYGHPRDLHSFPTRRSSDLPKLKLVLAGDCGHWGGPPRRTSFVFDSMLRDRKSTRLNSSHRCISYAVFCLKKKKKKRAYQRQ